MIIEQISAGQIFTDEEVYWFFFSLIAVICVISFLFGSSIASFLGVAAERPLRQESLNGRSHCVCGRKLSWHENIPVFGWLKARGKAKCCGSTIPKRYVISEAALGLTYAAVGPVVMLSLLGVAPWQWGQNQLAVALTLSAAVIVGSTVITFLALRNLSRESLTISEK